MLKRIIGLGVAATAVGMVAAAATAHNLKRSLVPTTDPSADEIVAVAIFDPLDFRSTSRNFRGGAARMLVRRRRPRPARCGARTGGRHAPGARGLRRRPDPRARPTGRSSRRSVARVVSRTSARRRATPRTRPSSSSRGLLIAGGFAVSSELADGGADFQADMESLRDNEELPLELEFDADPTPG